MRLARELLTIFQAMTVLHEEFNKKALEKQEAVKTGNMASLDQIIKDESMLVSKLRKLEYTREQTVKMWMQERGIVSEDVTMEHLLQFFPEEDRKTLQYWQRRLITEINKLKEQNEFNQQLIEESLRFVNMSLDSFHPQKEYGNYNHPGAKSTDKDDYEAGGRSLFDSKV